MRYLVVISRTPNNYCAGAPDVPGCVATGRSRKEVETNVREALAFHFEGMLGHGETLPEPTAQAAAVVGYPTVIHREGNEWRAFTEDLWPVIVAADTPERAEALFREMLPDYLGSLRSSGAPVPAPESEIIHVDVPLPVPA